MTFALAACSQGGGEEEPAERETSLPALTASPTPSASADGDAAVTVPSERSAYTRLDLDACTLVERIEEGGSATWKCPGHGDTALVVMTGDGRMDIDAGRDNRTFESLSAFNDIGETVEWRLDDAGKAYAIVYRLRTATPEVKPRSVLFVETVPGSGKPGCLLARIEGSVPQANVRARKAADAAAGGVDCGKVVPLLLGETA